MNRISQSMVRAWAGLGARYLPFADAATAEVPLQRLLRLLTGRLRPGELEAFAGEHPDDAAHALKERLE